MTLLETRIDWARRYLMQRDGISEEELKRDPNIDLEANMLAVLYQFQMSNGREQIDSIFEGCP